MLTYIVRRALYSIPVLVAASFLIFSLVSLSADPLAQLRANPKFSPESLSHLRIHYHLNKAIPVRYVYWLKDFIPSQGR